ncbi:hypothetical protein [Massilia sp. TS11]|uniref:hypothetical protein n=1 Tax=Massilia sp. TS11 TaxID=2908003 RepID=UPI001EDB4DBC|nr:hypothetical protein [Massilia sp. TS11]MCG2585940.1 hypothetical protein [Massilia sp. TS11]
MKRLLLACLLVLATLAQAEPAEVQAARLHFTLPDGWTHQHRPGPDFDVDLLRAADGASVFIYSGFAPRAPRTGSLPARTLVVGGQEVAFAQLRDGDQLVLEAVFPHPASKPQGAMVWKLHVVLSAPDQAGLDSAVALLASARR